jgi:hypothetical protein
MTDLRDEFRDTLRSLRDKMESEEVSYEDGAYDIVGLFAGTAKEKDFTNDPEFAEIFDLAADVELGPYAKENFQEKANRLLELLKKI